MNTTPTANLTELLLDPEQRGVEPREGQVGESLLRVKSVDEENRRVHFLCSTEEVDRYGEVISRDAWREAIKPFMQNPVMLAGHAYNSADARPTVIGSWVKLWLTDAGLEGIAEFARTPLAEEYWELYREGHMRAVSVGFLVGAYEMKLLEIDGSQQSVRVFTRVTLLEISAVAVPANASALARKALGELRSRGAADDSANPDDSVSKLAELIEPAIERVLNKKLDAGPGGHLCALIWEVIEAHDRGGHGHHDDSPDDDVPPPASPPNVQGDSELKARLRSLVEQLPDDEAA